MPETDITHTTEDLRRIYEDALASFVAKVKQDRYIIAAILYGSLAYDTVWEKSDIDIMLIARDDKISDRSYSLVENGVNLQVHMATRNNFKALLERSLQGSMVHSIMSRSTLLFSSDETIQQYYQNAQHVGSRDREYQMLNAAAYVLPSLTKAEKWLFVKKDPTYSFLWLMFLVNNLARIEVLLHEDVAGREVIKQALAYNPAFFNAIYTDLVHRPKDEATVRQAIALIHGYLDEKMYTLFKPILTYLADAGAVRSTTELHEHLCKKVQQDGDLLSFTYEWLASKGIIRRVSSPVRLTEKSRITLEEAAYYYDGGDLYGENSRNATDNSN